jgi:hypothetical protein
MDLKTLRELELLSLNLATDPQVPIGARSANLGTSEALDAGFGPLLLMCRLLLLCRNTDTAEVITRALAHQNSLERPARRR